MTLRIKNAYIIYLTTRKQNDGYKLKNKKELKFSLKTDSDPLGCLWNSPERLAVI